VIFRQEEKPGVRAEAEGLFRKGIERIMHRPPCRKNQKPSLR
jgi:hypothetical protein